MWLFGCFVARCLLAIRGYKFSSHHKKSSKLSISVRDQQRHTSTDLKLTYFFFFFFKLHFSHLLSLYWCIVLIRRQKLSLCYCYCGFLSLVIVSLSHDLISRNCHNPLPWEFGDHLVTSDQWTVHTKRVQIIHESSTCMNIKNFPVWPKRKKILVGKIITPNFAILWSKRTDFFGKYFLN